MAAVCRTATIASKAAQHSWSRTVRACVGSPQVCAALSPVCSSTVPNRVAAAALHSSPTLAGQLQMATIMNRSGYPARELRVAGYSIDILLEAGYSATQVAGAGYRSEQLAQHSAFTEDVLAANRGGDTMTTSAPLPRDSVAMATRTMAATDDGASARSATELKSCGNEAFQAGLFDKAVGLYKQARDECVPIFQPCSFALATAKQQQTPLRAGLHARTFLRAPPVSFSDV